MVNLHDGDKAIGSSALLSLRNFRTYSTAVLPDKFNYLLSILFLTLALTKILSQEIVSAEMSVYTRTKPAAKTQKIGQRNSRSDDGRKSIAAGRRAPMGPPSVSQDEVVQNIKARSAVYKKITSKDLLHTPVENLGNEVDDLMTGQKDLRSLGSQPAERNPDSEFVRFEHALELYEDG